MCVVAERVSNHKLMTLNRVSLQVEWLRPGRPPALCSSDVSKDSLLFVDLPADIQVERLRNYASKAAGITVHQIMFSPRPGVALVQYSAPIGLSPISLCACLSVLSLSAYLFYLCLRIYENFYLLIFSGCTKICL